MNKPTYEELAAQVEMLRQVSHEMLRAAQLNSELGGFVAAEWAGAYDVISEMYLAMVNAALSTEPSQALAEIRAEAVLQFANWAFDTCPNIDCMFDDKDDYIAKIRQGGAK